MLWQRVLTAVIAVPIVFILFYRAGFPLMLGSLAVAALGLYEFYRLTSSMGHKPLTWWGYCIGLNCILFGIYLWHGQYFPQTLWLLMVLAVVHFAAAFPKWTLSDLAVTFFGAFYVGGLLSFLIRLREFEAQGWMWVLLVFLLTWANDTAAYFVGSKMGKHPLCPKLSPNKTVEGFLGGLIVTILSALLFGQLVSGNNYFLWGLLGLLAAVVGTTGDLLESTYKRLAQAKDSGVLFPGHGGVLDRLDSLLLVAPLVYYFMPLL
ncbi:MAG TPA: phosphatidate cytidylyltransferase [Clostridia bacterium]|nr:phosphatidate cytidylyltransferase [Clostridia bacterium]